jgi:hypothetical protein
MKQPIPTDGLVSLSVRVPAETAALLRESAAAEDRPVAAHIRRLIKEHVEQYVIDRDTRQAA